jgi:hypothetical protein
MLTNVKPPRILYGYGDGFITQLAEAPCPHCTAMLRPSAVRRVDAGYEVICEACHRDVLVVTTFDLSNTDRDAAG